MKTFIDNAGRTWTVVITVDVIKSVRESVDVDLMKVIEDGLLGRLFDDPIFLCDVMYGVCKAEAEAKSISRTDFDKAMYGDVFDGALVALTEALVDFFRGGRRRVLQKALEKMRSCEAETLVMMEKEIDAMNIDEMLAEQTRRGNSSGSVPESLA